jgi:hypothetical protein
MRKEIELYERIESYIAGRLTEEEILSFEKQMGENPSLAEEVEKHRSIQNILHEGSLLEIRESLQKIHLENPGGAGDFLRKPGNYLIMLGALLITTSILLLTLKRSEPTVQEIPGEPPSQDRLQENVPEVSESIKSREVFTPAALSEQSTKAQKAPEKSLEQPVPEETLPVKSEKQPEVSVQESGKESKTGINQEPEEEVLPDLPAVPDCDTIILSAEILLEKSCFGKATGSLRIIEGSPEGGTPPYLASIDDGLNFYPKEEFQKLLPADYRVWLKDANNCRTLLGRFRIESVDCSYEYVFAPLKEERWKVPTKDLEAVLKIYNQQGVLVFQRRIGPGEEYNWDGKSMNGNDLSMGMYPFILEFNGGEHFAGAVTIVR